jgi:glycosyltransferase involved in cell wall biosynthesis
VQAEFFIGLTTGQKQGAMLVASFSGRIFFIFQVPSDFARATNRISILALIDVFAFALQIGLKKKMDNSPQTDLSHDKDALLSASGSLMAASNALAKAGMTEEADKLLLQAVQIELSSPELQACWGGPLNGQTGRMAIVTEVVQATSPECIIETGTYRGVTTQWFADEFSLPVHSCEIERLYYLQAKHRLKEYPKVFLKDGDSVNFLAEFCKGSDSGNFLFYLDAHWQEKLPLRDELRMIFRHCPAATVMIDDFRVPDDAGYGWDDYGPGKRIQLEILFGLLPDACRIYFPVLSSSDETGARRGCCVLASGGVLEDSKLLRGGDYQHWLRIQNDVTQGNVTGSEIASLGEDAPNQSRIVNDLRQEISRINGVFADQRARLYEELSAKEAVIQEISAAYTEAASINENLVRELSAKEAVIKELNAAYSEPASIYDNLKKELSAKEAVIQEIRAAYSEALSITEYLNKELSAKEAVIKELNAAYSEPASIYDNLKKELSAKEAVIQEIRAAYSQAVSINNNLNMELSAKETVITELNAAYLEAVSMNDNWHKELSAKDAVIKELNAAYLEAVSMNDKLQKESSFKETLIQNPAATVEALRKAPASLQSRSHYFLYTPIKKLRQALRALAKSAKDRRKKLVARATPKPKLGILFQHAPRRLRMPPYRPPHLGSEIPRITLVTPSFGQGRFIERTILSVLSQNYPALEYVVQDGGSTDETASILKKHESRMARWRSERDTGQSQAINRGFDGTSGEIMAWLNSDDLLLPGSLHRVAHFFLLHPEIDVVYGNRILIDENDRQIGRWIMPGHHEEVLSWADYVPQETLFWRRSIWNKAGGKIDESFPFAMDWDLIIRFREAGARFAHLPHFIGAFRVHPEQKTSAKINSTGALDMERIRIRIHGRVPSFAEINRNTEGFLKDHMRADVMYSVFEKFSRPFWKTVEFK